MQDFKSHKSLEVFGKLCGFLLWLGSILSNLRCTSVFSTTLGNLHLSGWMDVWEDRWIVDGWMDG